MIHVLVTVKPSDRCPGKNRLLWPYTYIWLLGEAAAMAEPVQIYVVGHAAEVPPLPRAVRYLCVIRDEHSDVVELAEREIAPAAGDVLVLAQLTQPLREKGLLARVAAAARDTGKSVVTATSAPVPDWRMTDADGCWRRVRFDRRRPMMDGALYAWHPGRALDIFDPGEEHTVVQRDCPPLMVDVDTAADIPPALPAMWAELMTR